MHHFALGERERQRDKWIVASLIAYYYCLLLIIAPNSLKKELVNKLHVSRMYHNAAVITRAKVKITQRHKAQR